MAQIPMTPGRSRMPGTPDLRTGTGLVSPEDMGSRQFGDWMRLGQSLGHAGQELQQWGIQKYNEKAEAEMLTARVAAQKAINEDENRIKLLTGSQAGEAPRLMEESIKKHSEAAMKTLSTPLAKEMFQRNILEFGSNKMEAADVHKLQEHERYRVTGLKATVDQEMNNAVVDMKNGRAVAGHIQNIKAANAQLYAGLPQEVIDVENRKSAVLTIQKVAGAIAVGPGGPQAALNFLNSGIEQEIGDGDLKVKFDALRAKYQASADNAKISATALSPEWQQKTADQFMVDAFAMHPDDPKKAWQMIRIGDVHRQKKKEAANAQAAAYTDAVWQEWSKTNFDVTRIPREVIAGNPELTKEMIAYRDTLDKAGKSVESLDPDLAWVDKKMDLLPSQLKEWLAKPGSYAEMLLKTGGKAEEYNKIRERARKSDEDVMKERGGGGGGGGSSASFNVTELFENSYGSMFTGLLGGAKTFDSGDDAHKQQLNGFRLRYNARVREKEADPARKGKKLDPAEQEQVAFDLIKDVRAKRVNLDSTYFDEKMAAQTASPELPVAKTELTEADAMLNRGEDVIVRAHPATGEPQKFGTLDLNSSDTNKNGVPVDIARRAKKAERAYQRMDMSPDVSCDRGDNLVYIDTGVIEVWDKYWQKMTGTVTPLGPLPPPAPTEGTKKTAAPPPIQSRGMKDRVEKLREQFGAENVKEEWNGNRWFVYAPGVMEFYDGGGAFMGRELAHLPLG